MTATASRDTGGRKTMTQTAIGTVRGHILRGTYPPGTHLQEIPLSQELNMSRTPVREALTVLAQEGLLSYAPKRGYTVRRFSLREVTEAYAVRETLEGMACRILAERGIDKATERELRAVLDEVDAMLAGGALNEADRQPWRQANMRFHSLLHETAGNRFLKAGLGLVNNLPMVSHAIIQWYDYDVVRRYHDDHHAVFDAIVAREGTRAEALMREHIHRACAFVRRQLTDTGQFGASHDELERVILPPEL